MEGEARKCSCSRQTFRTFRAAKSNATKGNATRREKSRHKVKIVHSVFILSTFHSLHYFRGLFFCIVVACKVVAGSQVSWVKALEAYGVYVFTIS